MRWKTPTWIKITDWEHTSVSTRRRGVKEENIIEQCVLSRIHNLLLPRIVPDPLDARCIEGLNWQPVGPQLLDILNLSLPQKNAWNRNLIADHSFRLGCPIRLICFQIFSNPIYLHLYEFHSRDGWFWSSVLISWITQAHHTSSPGSWTSCSEFFFRSHLPERLVVPH